MPEKRKTKRDGNAGGMTKMNEKEIYYLRWLVGSFIYRRDNNL